MWVLTVGGSETKGVDSHWTQDRQRERGRERMRRRDRHLTQIVYTIPPLLVCSAVSGSIYIHIKIPIVKDYIRITPTVGSAVGYIVGRFCAHADTRNRRQKCVHMNIQTFMNEPTKIFVSKKQIVCT